MIQETSPQVKRGSPNLPSNRRSFSLECGCMKQHLGREEVCHEYFVCRGQTGVQRGRAGTSQDTEHRDTVTGLSALLWGITLSPPLTQGEQFTRVLESMVT